MIIVAEVFISFYLLANLKLTSTFLFCSSQIEGLGLFSLILSLCPRVYLKLYLIYV